MSEYKKFVLGAAQFGMAYGIKDGHKRIDQHEVKKILEFAMANGINSIDTASVYGDSEKIIGKYSSKKLQVTTKLPFIPDEITDIKSWIIKQAQNSLERLKLERLDTYLIHGPDQLYKPYGDEIFEALDLLKHMGLIKKSGISAYKSDEIRALSTRYSFDTVQAPLNIFDQDLIKTNTASYLKKEQIVIQARSIFLQGLLLINKSELPEYFLDWGKVFEDYEVWLLKKNITSLEACVNYVYFQENIDKVIIGVMNVDQLKEILEASKLKLKISPSFNIQAREMLINPSMWRLS